MKKDFETMELAFKDLHLVANRVNKSTGFKMSRKELGSILFRLLSILVFALLSVLILAMDHIVFHLAVKVGNWVEKLPTMQVTFYMNYNSQICCNLSTTESTPGQSEDSTCPEEKRGWNPELQKNGETKVAELARLLRANSANGKKDTQSSWSAETKHLRYVSKV
ncbi:unnamed protein product [Ranitomeya imitator]|uniref:Dendritic cell-specific transmembrane protein-like domain-containing protein n=1 Tax=Ranitomeya imitator TaxID=111125 RepID=A0ABN9LZV9_9NEOB|nr:unnamed protein product [Ranitomeya imitator]